MQIRRSLVPGLAFLSFLILTGDVRAQAPAGGAGAPQGRGNSQPAANGLKPNEQQDVNVLTRTVNTLLLSDPYVVTPPQADAPLSADNAQGDFPIKWDAHHFVRAANGDTAILYTVTIDGTGMTGRAAAAYVRVVTAKEAADFSATVAALKAASEKDRAQIKVTGFSAEGLGFIDLPADGKVSRAMQLKPGRYIVFLAVKEKSPATPPSGSGGGQRGAPPAAAAAAPPAPKVGVLRHEIVVPDFNAGFVTSSLILATAVDGAPAQGGAADANPYIFGPMRVTPSADGKFTKQGEVMAVFWIYGAGPGAGGKPDVLIESSFYARQAAGGEKYFNRTAPQPLNATTLPPEFDAAKGHQLLGTVAVPLASFPAADYRLEIKVTDKPSGKVLTQSLNFNVAP